ncbi:Tad domain-containing protein [Pontixanthobacter sp.]|uniref:Tad domain-containing protein n=1 Tax=Pontixanthobacter sp. TaxID=2792078 RepID=UPI003C7D09BA
MERIKLSQQAPNESEKTSPGFLVRLAHDRSGNTIALIAAAILPLVGLVGSGIDMGRAYLAASRLQAACDAGVLAARKSLGTQAALSGNIEPEVAKDGYRFFNLNYGNGNYGTENRDFTMTLEKDFAISGHAKVDVPTSVMSVFGFDKVPISVDCQALLGVSDLDVMMVLDVTGSMRHSNPGDTLSRMDSMKQVVRNFHAQLESAKEPGSEIRYGFVPYATNVNVGHLLEDDWVVDQWTYQSRTLEVARDSSRIVTKILNENEIGGTRTGWITESSYPAKYTGTGVPGSEDGSTRPQDIYDCRRALPAGSLTYTDKLLSTVKGTDKNGEETTTKYFERTSNGRQYRHKISTGLCEVQYRDATDAIDSFEEHTYSEEVLTTIFEYKPVTSDVSNWRTTMNGCIEERASTEIADYDSVDLSQNLDLNIDLVPVSGNADTQWRPSNPAAIFARSFLQDGTGTFTTGTVRSVRTFAPTGQWWFSDCPARAQKLAPMTDTDVDNFLATLNPEGATYHDLGMIWGGRLLSPTGLYASENGDGPNGPRARHLIFLTDSQTEAYDLAYGAYGVEGLDQRRWNPSSTMSLTDTIEARFGMACSEIKKRNITVWVIAFGTTLNNAMLDCAPAGQYFEAGDASELDTAFATIASSIGNLRLSK